MGCAASRQDKGKIVKPKAKKCEYFCCCELRTLTSEGETYAFAENFDLRVDIFEAFYEGVDIRGPRRTRCQRIRSNWKMFFLDTLPTVCPPCPKTIIYKMSLQRLRHPSYHFERFGSIAASGNNVDYRLRLHVPPMIWFRFFSRRYSSFLPQIRCFYVESEAGRIACVYAANFSSNPVQTQLTVLYSHSNGADLGLCIGYIVRMARRFGANVIAYDYPGFGISTGPPSEKAVYQSAESVYNFVTTTLRVPSDQVVAIGTSLGTAATIHLAATRPVKAVVLQGAFLSALRVVCPFACRISKHDQYTNLEKIVDIRVPTLFVHGQKDKLFPVKHAKLLRRYCPGAANIEPLFVHKCSHLGFEDDMTYWVHLHNFLHKQLVNLSPDVACCSHGVAEKTIEIKARISNQPHSRMPITLCENCVNEGVKAASELGDFIIPTPATS